MNGNCAQNNAPKASRDKRNRLKKKHEKTKIKTSKYDVSTKTREDSDEPERYASGDNNNNYSPLPKKKKKEAESNNDSADDDDDLQLALHDISKQTRQVACSSSPPIAPPCVIKRKATNKNKKNLPTMRSDRKQISLPLETLRSATLRLQYPLQSSLLRGKKNHSDVGQPRLITISIDIIRCLLAESNWALMRRKNPAESFKLWFSTHDILSNFLNNGNYVSANQILTELCKVSVAYGLRESNYFELLGDVCNSLFETTILHNKMFDPDLVSVNQQKLSGDQNTKAKSVLKRVYRPIWTKMSETLNMITCGATLIGGKGDMFALQRCADNVLSKSKNGGLSKIIREATARTKQMATLGAALNPSCTAKQQQQQQHKLLPYSYPPPMFYTNGGLMGFDNNKAVQVAFAGLPQFTPVVSSLTTTSTFSTTDVTNTAATNTTTTTTTATTTTTTVTATAPTATSFPSPTSTSNTGLRLSPPRIYPPALEALQRNPLHQQITPVSDQEEEEEEEEGEGVMTFDDNGEYYMYDEF